MGTQSQRQLPEVSIHAPRVGCDDFSPEAYSQERVSIHAPRVGCDSRRRARGGGQGCFNSRTPCGVRPKEATTEENSTMFQFTHPVWGATFFVSTPHAGDKRFNSRTPCGVRQYQRRHHPLPTAVSIHAPRVGCDGEEAPNPAIFGGFNSRTPCGVRPPRRCSPPTYLNSFNSRTPCGVRPGLMLVQKNSTGVSIHAPRVGCDVRSSVSWFLKLTFQFTHPVWGATPAQPAQIDETNQFQFTHPVWGATLSTLLSSSAKLFQFTHPVWGATAMPKGTH